MKKAKSKIGVFVIAKNRLTFSQLRIIMQMIGDFQISKLISIVNDLQPHNQADSFEEDRAATDLINDTEMAFSAFGQANHSAALWQPRQKKPKENISDGCMANSDFGQSCDTAKRFGG